MSPQRDGALIDGWYYPLDDLIEDDRGQLVLRDGVIPMGERHATAAVAAATGAGAVPDEVPEAGAVLGGWYYPPDDLMVNAAGKLTLKPGVAVMGEPVDGADTPAPEGQEDEVATHSDQAEGAPPPADVLPEGVTNLSECDDPPAGEQAADEVAVPAPEGQEDEVAKSEPSGNAPKPGPHSQAGDKMTRADRGGAGGGRGNGGTKPPATGQTYNTKG